MSTRTKWILGIIGTIFLGAVGSGLWDLCLRDLFVWIGRSLMTLITLGIGSVRDSNYAEVAKGRTDRTANYLVSFAMCFWGILVGAAAFIAARNTRVGAASTLLPLRFLRWNIFLSIVFLTSIFWFRYLLISYAANAVDHFEQSYTICLPFLSAPERDAIRSEFAQVKSKNGYVAVLTKLASKARENNVELPKFSVW